MLLVAPMVRAPKAGLLTKVMVPVTFAGEPLMISVAEMVAILRATLVAKAGSVGDAEDDIRRALDRLFTGF